MRKVALLHVKKVKCRRGFESWYLSP